MSRKEGRRRKGRPQPSPLRGGPSAGPGLAAKLPEPQAALVRQPRPASSLWGWLALATVLLLAVLLSFREVSEVDLGFHLRAGQWIIEQGRWPQNDPFTYTVTDHPYIDLHWLYQIALLGLFRLGGSLALVVAHTASMVGAFALAGLLAWRRFRSSLGLAVLLFIGVLAAELRFMIRPEVLSWLFLGLTLLILERRASRQATPLWALPLILVLWVNAQGLFILGWMAIGCYLVGDWIERRRLDRPLALWGGASVLASFINPYLHRGVLFPLTLLTRLSKENPFGQTIGEFTSPWSLGLSATQPFYPRLSLWAYYALAIGALLLLLLTWRKHRLREFLLFVAFLVLGAQAIRNVPLFVLVALPMVAGSVAELLPRLTTFRPRRSRRPARGFSWAPFLERLTALPWTPLGAVLLILVSLGLGLRVTTNAYYIADRRADRFGYNISAAALPVKAAEFVREKGVSGRLFNHLNYGGFLMWQLAEPVFIDGRLEVMGEEFYQEYLTAGQEKKQLLALLERYDAQVVIFPYLVANSWLQQLRAAPQWRLVYYDDQSAIYLRADANPDLPAATSPGSTPGGLSIPVPAETRAEILYAPRVAGLGAWLEGFWRAQVFPQQKMNLGIFHYYLDQRDAAEAYLLDALQSSQGRYFEVYNNLGAVYFKDKRYVEAAFCYRTVLQEQPGSELARQRLEQMQTQP